VIRSPFRHRNTGERKDHAGLLSANRIAEGLASRYTARMDRGLFVHLEKFEQNLRILLNEHERNIFDQIEGIRDRIGIDAALRASQKKRVIENGCELCYS
jgi:hypothetical protein